MEIPKQTKVKKLGGEVNINHLTPEQLKNISFDYLNYDLIYDKGPNISY